MSLSRFLATAALVFTSMAASANGYIAGSAGFGNLSGFNNSFGFKLVGGYRVDSVFSFEGGYANLGTFKKSGQSDQTVKGFVASGIYQMSFSPTLSGLARIGAGYLSAERSVTAYDSTGKNSAQALVSFEEIKPLAGLGVELVVDRTFNIRMEWEHYWLPSGSNALGNASGDAADVLSIGLVARF